MKVDQNIHWLLRLLNDPEQIDWQEQYTGFDPQLILPDQITDKVAADFLLAYARFEDHVEALNAGKRRERPANQLYGFLREAEETTHSNTLTGVIKRAWFNTSVIDDSRGKFLRSYIKDYMFHSSETFQNMMPNKPARFGGTKTERRLQLNKENEVKSAYERQPEETWEGFVNRFLSYCKDDPKLSPRGFLDYLAKGVKPQYVEPWLLYIGQSIDEVIDACDVLHAPKNHKDYAQSLKAAFEASGLAEVVNQIRSFALNSVAQEEQRTIIHLDPPAGKVNHITRVGGTLTADGSVIRIQC